MWTTKNDGAAYEHSLSHAVEFFSKAGSLYEGRQSFYGNEESALSLFQKSWITDKETSFKLLLWLRDCRGGAGNRSAFRACIRWLADHDSAWVSANLHQLPEVGRWDDLTALYGTACENDAVGLWADAIKSAEPGSLACKWAGRRDNTLRKYLGVTPKEYRKMLVRGTQVVENKMCDRKWSEVTYESVPSVAMARYSKAFARQDEQRYQQFKDAVVSGDATIKARALFPHDCVRTARNGDSQVADMQFVALPNYFEDTKRRVICLCDSSGSMTVRIAGDVTAYDVSTSLSLYCSDRMPKESPYYRKFIQFEEESRLTDWGGMTFSEAISYESNLFNGAVGSTDIQQALRSLLSYAKMFSVAREYMPNTLMIVSDMQFNQGVRHSGKTEIEHTLDEWVEAGYERPSIVFWNTAGYAGSPATTSSKDVALVSGFSPSILAAVFAGRDLSAEAVLSRALAKYKVIVPS